ncbi:MAG: tRNA (adenosine(37)-N6)-threonylcarbamoyltransferase complex ATPase subunit type 1 TsaE [Candidatus Scalindua sp.]|nr:tRNA (adenosine(37)-N6)-threonylcarbamoyltransferase complex ATPase subunit type 1 TsaE [Candidatus Scalindua sp.]MBT5305609.1 tRNA (adenosine(37)-N6)-threonylcarbamoyltransferase complex ATPase subunit type 1 TsaE [Candidatus Scalindua sp.]MBT6051363.1 tRNA (adenosine(37)-N6)-threonylcarbamoyltransferase complex ATPase subunit type 1 TsaE [Candidatus Scalindua sp.]MBT6231617.1 tRNA (adenosine(37)-N6)-threonylcarbamoyltransferase complex ATPase subunit type 1 TsaE [Candidatus Scalindua sp.]M
METAEFEQTIEFGRLIGSLLKAGDVVALIGQLGAGKTHFTKGIAEGQGVKDRKAVTSPSYVIVKQYKGRLPIYHFDAYRLKSADEMYEIDCVGFFWGDGISIIEWADKVVECLPDEFIKITITILGKTLRGINVSYKGERYRNFMEKIKEKVKCLK